MTLDAIIDAIGVTPFHREPAGVIYCADCMDILPKIPAGVIDLVLTDPQYGIGESNEKNLSRGNLAAPTDYGHYEWDSEPITQELFDMVVSTGHCAIIWGGNYYRVAPSAAWLIWDKLNGKNDFADVELAWSNLPQAARIKRHLWNGMLRKDKEPRYHPTQKPLEIMTWCIGQANKHGENAIILDPFLGSGTTAVAAKQLGRKFIGVEIEEKYCRIAVERLRQEELFT